MCCSFQFKGTVSQHILPSVYFIWQPQPVHGTVANTMAPQSNAVESQVDIFDMLPLALKEQSKAG
jgi:hypothetical protein